jgi:hypothetical protein
MHLHRCWVILLMKGLGEKFVQRINAYMICSVSANSYKIVKNARKEQQRHSRKPQNEVNFLLIYHSA